MARYVASIDGIIKILKSFDVEDGNVSVLNQVSQVLDYKKIPCPFLLKAIDLLNDEDVTDYDYDEAKRFIDATIRELVKINESPQK